jgi:ParB/RepB/Spo0J family partition protein
MDASAPVANPPAVQHPMIDVRVDLIVAKAQIRKHFDQAALQELADSIKQDGLVQPIVIRTEGASFELIAGERRWRAAKIAGLATIPAILRDDLNVQDIAVYQAIENLQRVNLTLPEECDGVTALVKNIGLPETCKRLGKSKAWVSKRAAVLDMPEPVRTLIGEGLVRDLEIAGTLAQIQQIDGSKAKEIIQSIRKPQGWQKPPTRDSIRDELKWTQERIERDRKAKLDEAKRKEQEAKQQQQLDSREKKVKERERQMARVKDARKTLKDEAMAGLKTGLGLSEKQVNGWPRAIHVDYVTSDFPGAGGSAMDKFPEEADECNFEFSATGDVARLSKVAAGFTRKLQVQIGVPDLTLEQALRLELALKDIKDELQLRIETKVTGKELRSVVKRISGASQAKPPAAVKSPEKQGDITISGFLAECVDRSDKNAKVKAADLHAAYVAWCRRGKYESMAFNDNAWGDAIAAAGIEKKRSNGIQYVGCKIKAAK